MLSIHEKLLKKEKNMETENQKRIRVVLENAHTQLEMIDRDIRQDLLAVAKAIARVSNTTEVEYFEEIRDASKLQIQTRRETQTKKRGRGRPRKAI